MIRIATLFSSQEDIDRAMAALARAGVGEVEVRLVDSLAKSGPNSVSLTLPGINPAVESGEAPAAAPAGPNPLLDLDLDEDEITFFIQGIEQGGIVLLVEAEEKHAEAVKQILQEHGGEAAKEE